MKIVYQGSFLGEGLREAGHEVLPIVLDDKKHVNDQIAAVCSAPDCILLESWGTGVIPPGLHECGHRLVAWCIDSSINEYIFSDYLHLFDDVFVDQRSSVTELKKDGISARWLPLCVSSTAFREPQPKEYDISFVGHISDYRTKRKNLLGHIQKHFPVHVVEGVSEREMQDIFARSKIVLNENFFSGFTLRILQGMASGSLVLTEAGGEGVSDYFTDGTHLVCYSPATVLDNIRHILDNYNEYRPIALAGQEACRLLHTSKARAESLLACLAEKSRGREKNISKRKFYLAKTKYTACLRFGGEYSYSARLLNELLAEKSEASAWAAFTLGNIAARRGQDDAAVQYYMKAVEKGRSPYPFLKLAMLRLAKNNVAAAAHFIRKALSGIHPPSLQLDEDLEKLPQSPDGIVKALLIIARIYMLLRKSVQVGNLKRIADPYPDTAAEIGYIAWGMQPSSEILDFLLSCYEPYHIAGEILPEMLRAINMGLATERQIKRAGELAASYYDMELAQKLKELSGQKQNSAVL